MAEERGLALGTINLLLGPPPQTQITNHTQQVATDSKQQLFFSQHYHHRALAGLLQFLPTPSHHTPLCQNQTQVAEPYAHPPRDVVAMSLFVIVGKNEPVFEADFSTSTTGTSGKVRRRAFD